MPNTPDFKAVEAFVKEEWMAKPEQNTSWASFASGVFVRPFVGGHNRVLVCYDAIVNTVGLFRFDEQKDVVSET